jgi:hypothetical protein
MYVSMHLGRILATMVSPLALLWATESQAIAHTTLTIQEKIQDAISAAPVAIARAAAVVDWPKAGEKPPILRKGANGWTCFPDYPPSPGDDPMCLDKTWTAWFDAYRNNTEPQVTSLGIAYMLKGGSAASNSDPFATEPPDGSPWRRSAPHLMIITPDKLNPAIFDSEPSAGGPWIMWGGTPYEHLMIPAR